MSVAFRRIIEAFMRKILVDMIGMRDTSNILGSSSDEQSAQKNALEHSRALHLTFGLSWR